MVAVYVTACASTSCERNWAECAVGKNQMDLLIPTGSCWLKIALSNSKSSVHVFIKPTASYSILQLPCHCCWAQYTLSQGMASSHESWVHPVELDSVNCSATSPEVLAASPRQTHSEESTLNFKYTSAFSSVSATDMWCCGGISASCQLCQSIWTGSSAWDGRRPPSRESIEIKASNDALFLFQFEALIERTSALLWRHRGRTARETQIQDSQGRKELPRRTHVDADIDHNMNPCSPL